MKKNLRIILFTAMLTGFMLTSFADRGDRGAAGKKRTKVALNIKMPTSFNSSFKFNLRNGLKYNGSLISPNKSSVKTGTNTFITYQKGNSVYIIPYKQKIIVPDYKAGTVGAKLIIRLTK
jgi:hypothetical protein